MSSLMGVLGDTGKVVKYLKNSPIVIENSEGHSAFIILQGECNVYLNYQKENEQLLSTFTEGDIFGEMSLLADATRSATVVVSSPDAIICEIDEASFPKLIESDFLFTYKIYETLISRINNTVEMLLIYNPDFVYRFKQNHVVVVMMNFDRVDFRHFKDKFNGYDYIWNILKYLAVLCNEINDELNHAQKEANL